jgi:hypothetical protein
MKNGLRPFFIQPRSGTASLTVFLHNTRPKTAGDWRETSGSRSQKPIWLCLAQQNPAGQSPNPKTKKFLEHIFQYIFGKIFFKKSQKSSNIFIENLNFFVLKFLKK